MQFEQKGIRIILQSIHFIPVSAIHANATPFPTNAGLANDENGDVADATLRLAWAVDDAYQRDAAKLAALRLLDQWQLAGGDPDDDDNDANGDGGDQQQQQQQLDGRPVDK